MDHQLICTWSIKWAGSFLNLRVSERMHMSCYPVAPSAIAREAGPGHSQKLGIQSTWVKGLNYLNYYLLLHRVFLS